MICPKCHYSVAQVKDTYKNEEGDKIRRLRECSKCGHRFHTLENLIAGYYRYNK